MTDIQKFQSFKVNGFSWQSGTGIQDFLIKQCKSDDRVFKIIRTSNTREYHCFRIVKESEVLELIKTNNALHEVIYSYPRRVYFDVDVKKGEQFNLFSLLQHIRVYISSDEVSVYGYETEEAQSYHIILTNTYFENDEERLKFKEYMIFLKTTMPECFGACGASDSIVDTRVYSVRQCFKCIYQSKPNKPLHTDIKGCKIKDVKNTFITCFVGDKRMPLFGNCGNPSKYKEFTCVGPVAVKKNLPYTKTVDDKPVIQALELPQVSREVFETAKGLLSLCPVNGANDSDLGHSHRFKVLNFCYWNGLTFDDFSNWFKNQPDQETYQRRVNKLETNWKEMGKQEQYKISINGFKKYLGNFYPELSTSDDIQTSRFLSSFSVFDESKVYLTNLKNELLTPQHIDFCDANVSPFDEKLKPITTLLGKGHKVIGKYSLIDICMGGGKTTNTLQYLNAYNDKSFIWFAPRQTLVLNISERMTNEYKIKHTNHLKVGANKKKLKEADKLLICNQSLHYLDDKQNFDIVVIDEIESVLNSWSDSETHGDNMPENFRQFCRLIQNAKKVILLDAFITKKTINFIRNIELEKHNNDEVWNNHFNLIYSDKKPPYKKLVQNDNYDQLIEKIVSEIRQGKKLYIFYAFKTSKTTRDGILDLDYRIKRRIQQLDEEEAVGDSAKLKIMKVDTKEYKKSLVYFAESKEKNDLGDVNQKWTDSDFIITNTSITVGVNYEGVDYDKIYLLCSGSTGSPRDIIQTSMRIRKTKEDIIELFFFDVINKDFLKYPKYYSETDNNIFKSLIVDVYAEYHSDFVDSFKKFCDITNYDYSAVPILKAKEKVQQQQFTNDLYESNMLVEYSKIPSLDETTKELYENRIFERKATLIERLAVDKYYFENHYYHLSKDSRRLLWNFKGREFLKGMNDNIIKAIIKDNDVQQLEEVDLGKLKFSDETLEIIKNRFSSTIDSKLQNKIIIKAINNILGVVAIESKRISKNRANGFTFTDLFNTLNTIYKEHTEYKQKELDEYNEMIKNTRFVEDEDPVEYEQVDHKDEFNKFCKLKEQGKKIPKELKKYDLDL